MTVKTSNPHQMLLIPCQIRIGSFNAIVIECGFQQLISYYALVKCPKVLGLNESCENYCNIL